MTFESKAVVNALAGGGMKVPVSVRELVGNVTIATLDALTPTPDDAYEILDAGTPSAGTSDAIAAGDLIEFDGTSWKLMVAAVSGLLPKGTHAILSTQTALVSPYVDGVGDGEIVTFSGLSLTGAAGNESIDGFSVVVQAPSVSAGSQLIFSGSVPTGTWIAQATDTTIPFEIKTVANNGETLEVGKTYGIVATGNNGDLSFFLPDPAGLKLGDKLRAIFSVAGFGAVARLVISTTGSPAPVMFGGGQDAVAYFQGNGGLLEFEFNIPAGSFGASAVWAVSNLNAGRNGSFEKYTVELAITTPLPAFSVSGTGADEIITLDAGGQPTFDGVPLPISGIPYDGVIIAGEAGSNRQFHGVWQVLDTGSGGNAEFRRRPGWITFSEGQYPRPVHVLLGDEHTGAVFVFPGALSAGFGTEFDWVVQTAAAATETLQGVAELATQAEVNAGTDTTRIMTAARFAASSQLAAKLPLAGGTMTGPINMGTQAISNAGAITSSGFSGSLTGAVNGVSLTTGGAATDFLNATGSYGVPQAAGSAVGDLSGTYPNPSVATVGGTAAAIIGAHPALTTNPHAVTASQVGAYTIAQVNALVDPTLKAPEAFAPSGSYPTLYNGAAVRQSDTFRITSAGTMGTVTVNVEDLLIALVDTPGQTDGNWMVAESNRDQATETVKGVAELATQAEVDAGTDDLRIMTPARFAASTQLAGKLSLIGGTMSGAIDMDDNSITSVSTVSSASGGPGLPGVPINILGGAGGSSAPGAPILIQSGGSSTNNFPTGTVTIKSANAGGGFNRSGAVTVSAGNSVGSDAPGITTLGGAVGGNTGPGGRTDVIGGPAGSLSNGVGGPANLLGGIGGVGNNGPGGTVTARGGPGGGTTGAGGLLILRGGLDAGTGIDAEVSLSALGSITRILGNSVIGLGTPVSIVHIFDDSTGAADTGLTIEQTNISGNVLLHLVDPFARYVIGTDTSNDNELYITPGPGINATIGMNMDKTTGNVAMGNTTSSPSAVLTLGSQTKGFLPPRMTTAQKNGIAGASAGMIVYDSTTNELNIRGPSAFAGVLVSGVSAGGDLSGTLPSPTVATVGGTAAATIGAHPALTNNPHTVTAAQAGALPTTGGTMSGRILILSSADIQFQGGAGNNFLRGNVLNTGRLSLFTQNLERLSVSLGGVVNAISALQVAGVPVLTVAGGTMTGPINMGTQNITNVNELSTTGKTVMSGLKSGTLAAPPGGLTSGETWEDTTDSAPHPIVRIAA